MSTVLKVRNARRLVNAELQYRVNENATLPIS